MCAAQLGGQGTASTGMWKQQYEQQLQQPALVKQQAAAAAAIPLAQQQLQQAPFLPEARVCHRTGSRCAAGNGCGAHVCGPIGMYLNMLQDSCGGCAIHTCSRRRERGPLVHAWCCLCCHLRGYERCRHSTAVRRWQSQQNLTRNECQLV